jgi:hypothetical protein
MTAKILARNVPMRVMEISFDNSVVSVIADILSC